ncbi:hypothetical protein QYE76_047703 [Lolium multiflorum]|uniref:poly(A)-specific ribonuclease n=1 Tax=Lolium multiflorum TaxID=4521 RepID=A0AAD8TP99_LOLMU|nr:hypothetical protein QYE76_047703 [Lolium multiflorum]
MTVHPELAATGFAPVGTGLGPAAKGRKLEIRQVWAGNVDYEFWRIRQAAEMYPYVAMDTEFPGVVHCPSKPHFLLTPSERYAALKSNVDALHLIQVGLAFAPSPDAPPAIAFEQPREPTRACTPRPESVTAPPRPRPRRAPRAPRCRPRLRAAPRAQAARTWAVHSAYDFGYLVKLLMGRKLPRTLPEFLGLVRVFFGEQVYDVRHIMGRCPGLRGGLDAVAAALGAQREAGRAHQAGSDSALTWEAFRRVRQVYFAKEGVRGFAGVLFGLELELDLAAAANANKHGGAAAINNSSNNKLGSTKFVNNGSSNNKFASNGGGRCAVGGGNGGRNRSRNSRRVAPQVQVAVAALR